MTIRLLLLLRFILTCIGLGAKPWNFFQLNSSYFNEDKGIFSKMELNSLIPARWRLKQIYADSSYRLDSFPAFLKPEWGQNSRGVVRITSHAHLQQSKILLTGQKQRFLLQEAAHAAKEFEVFYVRSPDSSNKYSNLSITEVKNSSKKALPINGIHNPKTIYRDKTDEFSKSDKLIIWNHLKEIGPFRLARVSINADNKVQMLAGNFKIIEINLFLPMPLSLLDREKSWSDRYGLIQQTMTAAAHAVKAIPAHQRSKSIFFKKIAAYYKVKSWQHLEH